MGRMVGFFLFFSEVYNKGDIMRKIVLCPAEFVVADNLTYDQAIRAEELANKHFVGEKYNFYLSVGSDKSGTWLLMARDITWNEYFIKDPKEFIIDVDERNGNEEMPE